MTQDTDDNLLREIEEMIDKKLDEQRLLLKKSFTDELKSVKDNQDIFQRSIDRIDEDMGTDRKNFEGWDVRLGKVETVIGQIKQAWERHTKRLEDKMDFATEKAIESVGKKAADQVGPIVEEKLENFVSSKPSIVAKKLGFFKRLKNWFAAGW